MMLSRLPILLDRNASSTAAAAASFGCFGWLAEDVYRMHLVVSQELRLRDALQWRQQQNQYLVESICASSYGVPAACLNSNLPQAQRQE